MLSIGISACHGDNTNEPFGVSRQRRVRVFSLERKTKQSHNETACRFARGFVVELLSQGQMTGLCT